MQEIFQPAQEMLKDAVSGFMGLINTIAVLGILFCAVGTLIGSQQAKEKFKSGFFWIVIAFIVINLARQIVNAIGGYF